jgi:hypothetical protein
MGRTIEFNTGRYYGEEGQIIKAQEFGSFKDFDWNDDSSLPENDPYIVFEDLTRGIKGKITLCPFTEEAIMNHYDKGFYTDL